MISVTEAFEYATGKAGDFKVAIKYAIAHGRPGDVIVIAGKGHETYQEIKGVKYDMDDRVLIQEALKEIAEGR